MSKHYFIHYFYIQDITLHQGGHVQYSYYIKQLSGELLITFTVVINSIGCFLFLAAHMTEFISRVFLHVLTSHKYLHQSYRN